MNSKPLIIFLVLAFVGIGFTGCIKKRGCTSSFADNYDPEAQQDDDTCVPTREKFVGIFESNGTVEAGDDPGVLIPFDDVFVNIEDSTATSQDGLVLSIINIDADYPVLPLQARTSGQYSITIPRQDVAVFDYFGEGNINGRVLEIDITRIEEITLPDETIEYDTLYYNIYGIKELEE